MNKEIEETNNEVTKTNKYFIVRLNDDRGGCLARGPYTLKEAMDNAKRWSKDGSVMFVTEAKVKFEVEPKMTKVQ